MDEQRNSVEPVTVVIPVYNGSRFLGRAVDSVLSCHPAPERILIVDDGSTDDSCAIGLSLAASHPGRVQCIRSPDGRNRGVSAARNLGILAAGTAWIAFLDADDYYEPFRFEDFSLARQSQVPFDAIYQTCRMVFENDAEPGDREQCLCGIVEPVSGAGLMKHLVFSRPWLTAGIVVRREMLLRAGLFEESLSMGEDCHLWMRLACIAVIIPGNLERPVAAYARHAGNTTAHPPRERDYAIRLATDSLRWARRRTDLREHALRDLCHAYEALLVDGLMTMRQRRQRGLAWRVVRSAVPAHPVLVFRWAFLRQLQALLRESLGLGEPPVVPRTEERRLVV